MTGDPKDPPEGGGKPEAKRARRPARGGFDIPSSTVHPHADELETLTMARRYAAEGQVDRAIEIYEKLCALDPTDEEVGAELAVLRRERPSPPPPPQPPRAPAPAPSPAPPAEPRPTEPMGMLDLEEPPETYGVDECELIYKDPFWVFVYWEATDGGIAAARAQLGASGQSARLVLRLFATVAAPGGAERHVHDLDVSWNHGRRYLQSPHPGAQLRAAVGLLSVEGYFAPIAHSSVVRVPPHEPGPPGPVEWMEVVPGKTRGRDREPIVIVRRDHEHAERGPGTLAPPEPGAPSSGELGRPGSGSGSGAGKR